MHSLAGQRVPLFKRSLVVPLFPCPCWSVSSPSPGRSSSSTSRGGSNSTYNPQSLLSAVCCHAPVFKGKQQHDAHELMRMLLDGLQVSRQLLVPCRGFGTRNCWETVCHCFWVPPLCDPCQRTYTNIAALHLQPLHQALGQAVQWVWIAAAGESGLQPTARRNLYARTALCTRGHSGAGHTLNIVRNT